MALIRITINNKSFHVEPSRLDLNNFEVIKKEQDDLFDEFVYELKSGDYSYEWSQEKPEGKVTIEEALEVGGNARMIKEINLKNI